MRRVGRGDDDQVDSPVEQLIHAANECDIGIARVWRATALHDGRKAETLDHTNHRCVEYLAREAETDQSEIEHEGRLYKDRAASPRRSEYRAAQHTAKS